MKNIKFYKRATTIAVSLVFGYNVANYSIQPVEVKAENLKGENGIALLSIKIPTNPTNTLEYQEPTDDNLLGDASNWNGFILGDVTSAVDFEGTIAIRGDLSANGLTVNSVANDFYHQNTDDITLLVGGDININGYGSVWGNTATSNETVTNYMLSNVTQSQQTTQGEYLVVDSQKYFDDAEKTLKEANQTIASKETNANYTNNGYGSYNFEGNADVKEIVYTVTENDFQNYNMNFNIQEGQNVVVNLVTTEEQINFTNGSFSINGNKDDSYLRNNSEKITFNIVNSPEINMSSTALYGTMLAPNSNLNGNAANICGTTVVNNLDAQNGFELHMPKNPYTPEVTPTPNVPQITEAPNEPVVTPTPNAPQITEAPNEPVVTATPNAPQITEAPNEPVVTATPNAPQITEAPNKPVVTPTPNAPQITEAPNKPVVTATPNAPQITEAPNKPVVTPTPNVPQITEVPNKPVPTKPPKEDIPKTADVTDLIIIRDALLMAISGYGFKKILKKGKGKKDM